MFDKYKRTLDAYQLKTVNMITMSFFKTDYVIKNCPTAYLNRENGLYNGKA